MVDEITEKVLSSIASITGRSRDQISENTPLANLGIDSLDVINLLFDLEEKFKISIPGEPSSITNVNQIVEGIRKLTSDPSRVAT
jgi:acyl carrier protein